MDAMRSLAARLRQEEQGFSLIELLVAIVLIAVAITATAATFDRTRQGTKTGEQLEVMSHVAQADTESIISQSYATIGVQSNTIPTAATPAFTPTAPLSYIVNGPPKAYAYNKLNTSTTEPFVTELNDTTCVCNTAFSRTWSDGRYSGTVYRFITWVDDPCARCAGTQNYKRVTIVVTSTGRLPVLTSTIKRLPT
jgi:prepilin-type N-terminal cleavage/methylation domain-containing protein